MLRLTRNFPSREHIGNLDDSLTLPSKKQARSLETTMRHRCSIDDFDANINDHYYFYWAYLWNIDVSLMFHWWIVDDCLKKHWYNNDETLMISMQTILVIIVFSVLTSTTLTFSRTSIIFFGQSSIFCSFAFQLNSFAQFHLK